VKKILIISFVLAVFFLAFLPVKDTDFGWHYRCGKEIWHNPTICINNNFSYFLPKYRSSNPHFIYDIVLAFVFDRFGFLGLVILYGLLISLSSLLFLKIGNNNFSLKTLAFYLIFFLSYPVFGLGLRSQILSYVFFLLSLLIVERAKNKKSALFWFLPLTVIWVNTHIGFFIVYLVYFSYFVEEIIREKKGVVFLFLILLGIFTSSLFNPFSWRVYQEIFNHATAPMQQMISEWTAPPIWNRLSIVFLFCFWFYLFLESKKKNFFYLFLNLIFMIMAMAGSRNLPFFYTTIFLGIFDYFTLYRPWETVLTELAVAIGLSLGIVFAVINIPSTLKFHQNWDDYCRLGLSQYPCKAIKQYPQLSGNVFAMYEWGGFLIWQKPKIKVFVDGRMPAWRDENGNSPYRVFLKIIQTRGDWNKKLIDLKTDYLLIGSGSFLDLFLQKNAKESGWGEVYRDETAVIYKRNI